jgi:hypothetical protein
MAGFPDLNQKGRGGMESHSGKGVVTFESGEVMEVSYSLTVSVVGALVEVRGSISDRAPQTLHWLLGKKAVLKLQTGPKIPIAFDHPPHFGATGGPF